MRISSCFVAVSFLFGVLPAESFAALALPVPVAKALHRAMGRPGGDHLVNRYGPLSGVPSWRSSGVSEGIKSGHQTHEYKERFDGLFEKRSERWKTQFATLSHLELLSALGKEFDPSGMAFADMIRGIFTSTRAEPLRPELILILERTEESLKAKSGSPLVLIKLTEEGPEAWVPEGGSSLLGSIILESGASANLTSAEIGPKAIEKSSFQARFTQPEKFEDLLKALESRF